MAIMDRRTGIDHFLGSKSSTLRLVIGVRTQKSRCDVSVAVLTKKKLARIKAKAQDSVEELAWSAAPKLVPDFCLKRYSSATRLLNWNLSLTSRIVKGYPTKRKDLTNIGLDGCLIDFLQVS